LGFWRDHSRHKRDFAGASLNRSDDHHTDSTLIAYRYRPAPEPGAGVNVDPLGEVLTKLFPDGFRALFAPAAALPASLLMPPLVELPVVVPVFGDPVAVLPGAAPPTELVPPVEPVPVCATANVLASVSAVANPRVLSFMVSFLSGYERKNDCARICSGVDFNWV
jgi:hypothetical protein